jgi:hypothetical protein
MHRAALEVSGDVSPMDRFLGTDGVCGGGAVGRRNNQRGESITLPSPRRHVVQWRFLLTSASVMMDDERGGFLRSENSRWRLSKDTLEVYGRTAFRQEWKTKFV